MSEKKKRGRPVGSGTKREGTDKPSTMSPIRKRGRPVGSGRKREGKEERMDHGMLM